MDEPLGTLDTEFRDFMVHELRELHNRIHATTVYVTHDQHEAMAMADKIAVMNHGVIEQFGTAAGDLRSSGDHVRRRLHRLAADELLEVRRRACSRARRRSSSRVLPSPCRRCARMLRRQTWRSASGPNISASTRPRSCAAQVYGTEYLGTTQIVDGGDRGRHDQGARAGRHHGASSVSRSASRSTARGCRCSSRRRAARSRTAHPRGSAAWLTCRCAA